MRVTTALIAGALTLLCACGGSSKSSSSTPTSKPAAAPPVTHAPGALVARYSVPLPDGAQPYPKASIGTTDSYMVPSMTYDQLRDFFHTAMPIGKPWHGLSWCDEKVALYSSAMSDQLSWQISSADFLIVTAIRETPTSSSINVTDDTGDPGPCKDETFGP